MDTGMERALKDGVQRLQQNLWPINRVVSQTTTRTESSSVFTVNPLLGEYLKPIAVLCKKHHVEALHTFNRTKQHVYGSRDLEVSF
jgi:hypothetical protein